MIHRQSFYKAFSCLVKRVDNIKVHHFPLTRRRVATPVDWRQGGAVIVAPSVKPEDAPALFPKGVKQHEVPSGKVRTVGGRG